MRIGMQLRYGSGRFFETINELADYERAGLQLVSVAELYSFDAVSQLGFIAAKSDKLLIQSSILQIYTRTPTLTAMTAAGLDYVSGGRFILGIGASGPQVIEGFHGVPYDAPLGRTRELIEICRMVWRREKVMYDGKHYTIPLPADQGTGLGKPLKMIDHPVRPDIPIVVAAIGPKNIELTAELAQGWQPIFFLAEHAKAAFGDSLDAGLAKRDPALGPLEVYAPVPLAIGEGVEPLAELYRPNVALYVGGMGARGKNFYNDLAKRYGYEEAAEKIQDLYLEGRKDEAAAAVPADLIEGITLIGSKTRVKEKLELLAAAGVTTLQVDPMGRNHEERLANVEALAELCS